MDSSDSKRERRYDYGVAAALLVGYLGLNITLNVYHKWLFSGPLKAPLFLTMTHQIYAFMGAACTMYLAKQYKRTHISNRSLIILLAVPFGYCANVGLNNLALAHSTLALNQLTRSLTPIAVAVMSCIVQPNSFALHGPKQTLLHFSTLICLAIGIFLGLSTSPDFRLAGFLVCVISVLGVAIQFVVTSVFVGPPEASIPGNAPPLHAIDVIFYTSLPAAVILLAMSLSVGELTVVLESYSKYGIMFLSPMIITGGALSFLYSILIISIIKRISAVYLAVAAGFKMCLVIGFSFLFFDQQLTLVSGVGIAIACCAFLANSYLEFTHKQTLRDRHRAAIEKIRRSQADVDQRKLTKEIPKKTTETALEGSETVSLLVESRLEAIEESEAL
ncbi:hypothetical protein AAMO2058_001742800 [Amorphochlora amoebiformis]